MSICRASPAGHAPAFYALVWRSLCLLCLPTYLPLSLLTQPPVPLHPSSLPNSSSPLPSPPLPPSLPPSPSTEEDGSPRYPGTSTHGGASTSYSSPSSSSTTATATGTIPRNTSISHLSQEANKVKTIRDAIRAEDKRLRTQYFFLRDEWQDAVGSLIFLTAAFTWAFLSYSWYTGALSTPLLILGNALAISLLHEMEHDLIHDLYFKRSKAVQNAMFAFIWVIKR